MTAHQLTLGTSADPKVGRASVTTWTRLTCPVCESWVDVRTADQAAAAWCSNAGKHKVARMVER